MTTILTLAYFDTNVRQPKPGGDLKMAFAASSESCVHMELDHSLQRIRCSQMYQNKEFVCFVNMSHVVAYVEADLPPVESVPDVSPAAAAKKK